MTALNLIEELKKLPPDTPIVVVDRHENVSEVLAVETVPAGDYRNHMLGKPLRGKAFAIVR